MTLTALYKTVGLWRGRCPRAPGPLSEMGMRTGHLLARAGKALPQNPRGGKGSLCSVLRADPLPPGEAPG